MSNTKWDIDIVPEGDHGESNPGVNQGGLVIYLVSPSGAKEEFSRVAFVRRNSKNTKTSFKNQWQREKARAMEALKVLNESMSDVGTLA